MEQSPSKADSSSAGQEIPRILWDPNDNYRVHRSLSLVSILSYSNPVHVLRIYFFKIYFNIILQCIHTS